MIEDLPHRTAQAEIRLFFRALRWRIILLWLSAALAAPSLPAQVVDCYPLPEGIIGFWRGNGDLSDALDKMDAEERSTVGFAGGVVQDAFLFNGSDDTIFIPDSTNLWLTSFTIEAWIKPAATTEQFQLIFIRGDTRFAADPYFLAISPSGQYQLHIENATGQILNLYGGIAVTETWQHVAGTYDQASGLLTLYKDGSIVAQQTTSIVPFGPLNSSAFVTVGSVNRAGNYYKGLIDELSLYNRALSQSEILGIVQAGEAGKCGPGKKPELRSNPKNQIAFWGDTATFSVQVEGDEPLAYQWYKNTFPISWGTNFSLTLQNLELTDGGDYYVVVTNAFGEASSTPARLTVNPAGVSFALYSGITIEGTLGKRFGVQYTTNLTLEPDWIPLQEITLQVSPYLWLDTNSSVSASERRFYRVIPIP